MKRSYPILLASTLLASWATSALATNWYPRMESENQVSECVPWSESDGWLSYQAALGSPCDAKLTMASVGGTSAGCEKNANTVVFHTRESCETFKFAINSGKNAKIQDHLKQVAANPDGWVNALDRCYRSTVTPELVSEIGIQSVSEFCLCNADRLGHLPIEVQTTDITQDSLAACARKVNAKAFGAGERKILGKIIDTKRQAETREVQLTKEKKRRKVVIGQFYNEVMTTLSVYKSPRKKTSIGEYLWASYTDPNLLLYPDAPGECKLMFGKGKLEHCEGCSPENFTCD